MTVLQDSLRQTDCLADGRRHFALLVVVGTSVWLTYRTTEDTNLVIKERQSRELATTLMDLLQDMETGHRGFLLTREPRIPRPL